MFSMTNEVYSADAKDQIMHLTKNLLGFPKNESLRICELLKMNETIGYGYINAPSGMGDAMILNAIRYKDAKDNYFKHLLSWFELDFAWYDKESRQVMLWGDHDKVKDSIVELKELLENTLLAELDKERERRLERADNKEFDEFKHT